MSDALNIGSDVNSNVNSHHEAKPPSDLSASQDVSNTTQSEVAFDRPDIADAAESDHGHSASAPPTDHEPPATKPRKTVPASVSLLPSEINPIKTMQVMRMIGYGLLALATIDLIYIIVPPEFTKPIWEYQTMGDMVRLIPVPMLAFMLVFYGETTGRKRFERPLVFAFSWSTLVFGVVFLLMIPLTVVNTLRIAQYNNDQINIQVQQQKLRLDNTRNQIQGASPDDLEKLIPRPSEEQAQNPNIPKTRSAAKAKVLTNLEKAQSMADEEADKARKNVEQNLYKNSFKLVTEALIGSTLFFYTWFVTPWARRRQADAYEEISSDSRRQRSTQKKPIFGKGNRRLRRQ